VDIDRDLRAEFRRALAEVTPPAPWLGPAVREELRNKRQKGWKPMAGVRPSRSSPRPGSNPWLRGFGRASSLVAGLLVLLLVVALVVGLHLWRNADLNTRPVPAVQTPTIKQYQALVSADLQKSVLTNGFTCSTFDDGACLPKTATADAAEQHWLDDLNNSQPPARFAALDALMRRHLARILSADISFVAGFKAKDPKATGAASDAVTSEIDALQRLAGDIVASRQGTIASYTAAIRVDKAILFGGSDPTNAPCCPQPRTGPLGGGSTWCLVCQLLVNGPLASCQAGQAATCASQIAVIRVQVETFQGHLVLLFAPDSLAVQAARLQVDLAAADASFDTTEAALTAGDQVGLQTGQEALGKLLGRVDSDAAAIVGSN